MQSISEGTVKFKEWFLGKEKEGEELDDSWVHSTVNVTIKEIEQILVS